MGLDPELFPSPENINRALMDLKASEVRAAATKKSTKKPQPSWDRNHIRTTVNNRLDDFSFLNDPPTAAVSAHKYNDITRLTVIQGEAIANPTLAALCRSFYEEEKWQRALAVHLKGDNEWINSVTVTMVSLAATTVRIYYTRPKIDLLT